MSNVGAKISLGLVHWPTFDKTGATVCTNVTNLDIHDIARASCVFGVEHYYIINRMREQLSYVERIMEHWRLGKGATYNHMRKTALHVVRTAETISEAKKFWADELGYEPKIVATSAREVGKKEQQISFRELREKIKNDSKSAYLIIFGTGFGLHDSVLDEVDYVLEPIRGVTSEDYRHLSVRSAVTICLDRLRGAW